MKRLVRCKACGYIMEADRVRDKCPACGVPAKQFEAYEERISDGRRRILDLHMHPIVVHLPQAFSAFLLPLAAGLVLTTGPLRLVLLDATRVLASVLPLSVLAAFAAGLIDGKIRFRRVTTPILVKKMLIAGLFFVASLAGALVSVLTGLDGAVSLGSFAVLSLVGFAAAVLLGLFGFPLIVAKFPG